MSNTNKIARSKIEPSNINRPVDSYSVITNIVGVISEMGSPDFNKRTHIFLDGFDYKIYTTPDQDNFLKEFYRKLPITLKVKQKKSIRTDRVISAALLNAYPKTAGSFIENISNLSHEDLSFLKPINTEGWEWLDESPQPSPDGWREEFEIYIRANEDSCRLYYEVASDWYERKLDWYQNALECRNNGMAMQDERISDLQSQLTQLREENERLNKLVNNMRC